MKKEMLDMKVSTLDENILIEQSARGAENDSVVVIFPEQVDILIEWLKEAKAEIDNYAKAEMEVNAKAEVEVDTED